MRICRFRHAGESKIGYYSEQSVVPLADAAEHFDGPVPEDFLASSDVICYLPNGQWYRTAKSIFDWLDSDARLFETLGQPCDQVQLLTPVPRPNKLLLLAGNYAAHVEEGGEMAAERSETFPYVFMKPPSTTLVDPNQSVALPSVSADHIDYELELAVIIGKTAKDVSEKDALHHVAGYTIVNDLSDRKFRPNLDRRERDRDKFFDWMHGKWHDGFCPCGPCVTSAATIPDPQALSMKLSVNGQVYQDASTALQVFPVAAVIEFISSFATLEPGDIISTGTPAGVGAPQGRFLQPGDSIEASIESIGVLHTKILKS